MDLTSIAVIAAVAEAGNVTRAARRHGISQPKLDRALRAFDRKAGQPLFFRWRNDIRLTAAGHRRLQSPGRSVAA
jgi:DNA-binding transcriptional LysR family regulator